MIDVLYIKVEMGLVFLNERNLSLKRVDRSEKNERWTNKSDRSENRKKILAKKI